MQQNFQILELPIVPFRISTLQSDHYFNNGQINNYATTKQYIDKYFFETQKGTDCKYYFYNATLKTFEIKSAKDFTDIVLNKLENNKELVKYFKMNSKIYSVVAKLNRPLHFIENGDYYINECRGLLHKTFLPFKNYSSEIKKNVQKMLDFILEITSNNDKYMFDCIIKWYAQVCRGVKTQVILYKKAHQGVGKSTESDFILQHVLGHNVAIIGNTEPLVSNFNKPLLGKLLVVFEELPIFSKMQWSGVSSKLKTLCTENSSTYRDVYEKPIVAENINNFIINTNVESIKDSDGRRIVILEISHSRLGDYKYFEDIHKSCFNNEVGEAFFSYLNEIDISNFYAQRDFPVTDKKKTAIANLLPIVHKFLKSYYLNKLPISKVSTSELYLEFTTYATSQNSFVMGRNDFYDKLKEISIERTKSNGSYFFNVPIEKLKQLSNKYKWICEYDNEDIIIDEDDVSITDSCSTISSTDTTPIIVKEDTLNEELEEMTADEKLEEELKMLTGLFNK